ncbi:membrane protein [Bacillus sp. SB49]|nr:hypothetical protein D479_01370 [Halobacillus sp. BAB-2008]QHT48605.1 membrane protein [Bacillus sp. SB49]
MRNFVIKAFFYLLGLTIMSLGIAMTIEADLGAGAWDAINVGLVEIIGLTVGTWVIIIGAILIVVNALIAKEKPDILAVITILVLGRFIDFWLLHAFEGLDLTTLWSRIGLSLGGIVILGIGVSLYLQPQFSLNPIDNLMISLRKRFGFSITISKTMTEGFALVVALLVGGPVGIGTILILVFIGPMIQFFEGKANQLMNKLLSE